MKPLYHTINEDIVTIRLYDEFQQEEFYEWLKQPRTALSIDTETTGLDIYSPHGACRLVQFGDTDDAWVIPARYLIEITVALDSAPLLVAHNSTHELHTLDRHLGISIESLQPRLLDSFILSHIVDPRSQEDTSTAIGHSLDALTAHYVDPGFNNCTQELKDEFKALGFTLDTGYALIPEDNETYVRYAGLDVIATARVLHELLPLLKGQGKLVADEHRLQNLLARMERKGMLIDEDYVASLHAKLDGIVERNEAEVTRICRDLGTAPITKTGQKYTLQWLHHYMLGGPVPKIPKHPLYAKMTSGSNQVIVASLLKMGEELTETTDTGNLSVDREVLNRLCDLDKNGDRLEIREPNVLAQHVKAAKRAGKWKSAYVDMIYTVKDTDSRIHPKIQGLKARTGRMAISRPPLQQQPSSGRLIRDCFIADPGHLLFACDYDQVEMKILAALCEDPTMVQVMLDGLDIFDYTSEVVYGSGFTKQQRGALKATGYGTCYGGGPKTISKQTGLTVAQAKEVQGLYLGTYPGIKIYSKALESAAMKDADLAVYNPYGRKLPLDDNRVYAALNYMIQSTARDVFAQALLRLDDAGLGDYLLLPVHDEVIGQAPIEIVEDVAKQVGELMSSEMNGVPLTATGEVVGPRWGYAYHDKKICTGDKENCECP